MDQDSKMNGWLRLAPWLMGGFVVLIAGALVLFKALDGKDFLNALGYAGTIVGVGRAMGAMPSATTTTKQTDPSGMVTETKTQAPLGMSAPAVVIAPAPAPTPPLATP